MLVLSRRPFESIHIDGEIKISVLEVRGNRVRLGIEAPEHIRVARSEVWVDADDVRMQTARSSGHPASVHSAAVT